MERPHQSSVTSLTITTSPRPHSQTSTITPRTLHDHSRKKSSPQFTSLAHAHQANTHPIAGRQQAAVGFIFLFRFSFFQKLQSLSDKSENSTEKVVRLTKSKCVFPNDSYCLICCYLRGVVRSTATSTRSFRVAQWTVCLPRLLV